MFGVIKTGRTVCQAALVARSTNHGLISLEENQQPKTGNSISDTTHRAFVLDKNQNVDFVTVDGKRGGLWLADESDETIIPVRKVVSSTTSAWSG